MVALNPKAPTVAVDSAINSKDKDGGDGGF